MKQLVMPEVEIRERVHQLVDESDNRILRAVEAMLEAWQEEKWSKEEIEDLNREIEQSELEIKDGQYYTQEEVLKMSAEWKHQKE
jgi:hypothetical protein